MSYRQLLRPHLSGPALDRLVTYAELLDRWARVHNLVHFASPAELVQAHLLDALADGGPRGAAGQLLDVGSGAGLPGVPRLCVAPGWNGVLVEPRQKRWAFLRTVVRELGLSAAVERCRFQDLAGDRRLDEVTARAVGGHAELLAWARGRLAPGGAVLLWLGPDAAAELASASGWRVVPSARYGHPEGRLLRLEPCFT